MTVTARTLPGWAAITAVAAAMAAPVAVVAWSLTDPDTAIWQQLWRTRLPGMLRDTVTLSVAVLAGTLVLGTALTGDDVGTPILGFVTPAGKRVGFFGPVITRRPPLDDALRLWDGLTMMAGVDGFWELKRTRTEDPDFTAPA